MHAYMYTHTTTHTCVCVTQCILETVCPHNTFYRYCCNVSMSTDFASAVVPLLELRQVLNTFSRDTSDDV